jgi:hypothetical protein
MSLLPTARNFLDDLGSALNTFNNETLPMVQATYQSAEAAGQTLAKGKSTTPIAPSTAQELVPRDMGNLSSVGAGISGTMLVVGLIAVAAVFFMAKRR